MAKPQSEPVAALPLTGQAVVILLPGEPRGWGRVRVRVVQRQNGPSFATFYMDAETRAYEQALKWMAKTAMRSRPPIGGPVSVRVTASMGIPRSWSNRERDAALAGVRRPTGKPDWDNFAKVLDALNGVVWVDDAQVVEGTVMKVYSEETFLRVEVCAL